MSQITTHVLDTTSGKPAAAVPVKLYHLNGDSWLSLGEGRTNDDGRILDLLDECLHLPAGTYRMHFDTHQYFLNHNIKGFYPYVDIVFELHGGAEHYHIPLLLSPFGYSTYRGS